MRKWINGKLCEGTPVEIAEYERIVSGKKRINTDMVFGPLPIDLDELRYMPDITCGNYPFTTFI